MGGIFSKPKEIKAPSVPPPESIPVVPEEEPPKKKKKGFGETILTGELEPLYTKKTFLGG